MTVPQQKIVKFVQKLNQNSEYTKLTSTQLEHFHSQFQQLQQDEKQSWIDHSTNEIACILVEGHIHKAQTYFVFMIEMIDEYSLETKDFSIQIDDLLEKCFMDSKKLKKKQFEEFQSIFKSIGVTSGIREKKKIYSHQKSFFGRLCACLSWK